jgi:hypothetical protein
MQIVGKRYKQRTVYLLARAASWVNAWLVHLAARNGPLFCPVHWAEALQHCHMTPEAIGDILTRRARKPESPASWRTTSGRRSSATSSQAAEISFSRSAKPATPTSPPLRGTTAATTSYSSRPSKTCGFLYPMTYGPPSPSPRTADQ